MKPTPKPVSVGVAENKLYGYMAYFCFNDGKTTDIREFFQTREEANDWISKTKEAKGL